MPSPKLKTILVLLLTGAALYLGGFNLVDRSRWQEVTDGIEWGETTRGLEVMTVTAGFRGASERVLEKGNLLLSINGIPIGGLDDLTEVQELLSDRLPANTPATYVVQQAGGGQESVPVLLTRNSQIGTIDILLALVGVGFLLSALYVFVRCWHLDAAFHFYLVGLTAFVVCLYRYSGRADAFDLWIYWLDVTAFLLLPPLFLHFCSRFPRPLEWIQRWPRAALIFYVPGCFLWLVFAAWFGDWLSPLGLSRVPRLLGFFDQLHLLHFLAFMGLATWVLLQQRQWAGPFERQQLKWIALGTIAALGPLFVGYALPYLAGWQIRGWMEACVLSLLLIPLVFAYAFSRYRLPDVDLIFKQSLAYVLSSSALVGLYVGLTILIGQAFEGFAGSPRFPVFATAALISAFLFAPLKNRIQEQIDRHFYKDRYDFRQSIASFGRALSSQVTLSGLVRELFRGVTQTLDVGAVGIFFRTQKAMEPSSFRLFKSTVRSEADVPDLLIPDASEGFLLPSAGDRQVAASMLLSSDTLHAMDSLQLSYLQPLRSGDRVLGFLGLGTKKNGSPLSSDDLHLLHILSDYAAVALENALLYRSLETKATQLTELKAYSENVIESIAVGICVIDTEGFITTWNSALERLYGLEREKTLGKPLAELLPESFLRTLERFWGQGGWIVPRAVDVPKIHLECADGRTRLVRATLAPFCSSQDASRGTLIVIDDVTEKAQLEDQLLQAEKLSSIGLFAAGVAHEVNTPLAGISSYTQMLIEETDEKDPHRELLEKIEKQSFRASEIINNLLNFSRTGGGDWQEVNLNSLLLETLSLLDHSLKKNAIQVELDLDPGLPATIGHGGKLQQVFMNLFLNAKDAMPRGGRMSVRSERKNSEIIIQVGDSGTGISEDTIRKIYDPFFTTKTVGKGTGLGLSVTYGIVQEHSGRISVDSHRGEGSTFTVQLPLKRLQ